MFQAMAALRKPVLIDLDDYLAAEVDAPVKREYLAGEVYAMAGSARPSTTSSQAP